MKLKKILAGVAAAAMTVSAMTAISASAVASGATVVDFEDGVSDFVYINDMDGGSKATISVEDYNGSKQLKIDPADGDKAIKIWFDLDGIADRATTVQIGEIQMDITFAPKNEEEAVGWVGGAIGSSGGFDRTGADIQGSQKDPKWSDKGFDGGAYNPGEAATIHATKKFILGSEKYTESGANPFFCIMRWARTDATTQGDYYVYVDNIKLLDSKGNALSLGVSEAAPETTEATEAEATETETEATEAEEISDEVDEVAPVATEAVVTTTVVVTTPAADVATASSGTGNVAAASIAGVMALAGAVAIVSKKRK